MKHWELFLNCHLWIKSRIQSVVTNLYFFLKRKSIQMYKVLWTSSWLLQQLLPFQFIFEELNLLVIESMLRSLFEFWWVCITSLVSACSSFIKELKFNNKITLDCLYGVYMYQFWTICLWMSLCLLMQPVGIVQHKYYQNCSENKCEQMIPFSSILNLS